MNKRIRNIIILFAIILGIPLALYLENLISTEISNQNYINVEKSSPAIEITGTIDFPGAYADEVFFIPKSGEGYKIEHTGVEKVILVASFIDKDILVWDTNLHDKQVRIKGVLVNDDPNYGKPEKTYDAIIIVQQLEVLN